MTVFSNAFNINARRAFQNMSIIKAVEGQLQSVWNTNVLLSVK